MRIAENPLPLLVLLFVFGTPLIALVAVCNFRRARESRGGRVALKVFAGAFLLWLGLFAVYVVKVVAPWRNPVRAQGFSAEGREYCVVQTFDGFTDYQVSFYLRDTSGVWHWNYLAHDDDSWGDTSVEFSGTVIRVRCEGVVVREIRFADAVKPAGPNADRAASFPVTFSVADVAAAHRQRFR